MGSGGSDRSLLFLEYPLVKSQSGQYHSLAIGHSIDQPECYVARLLAPLLAALERFDRFVGVARLLSARGSYHDSFGDHVLSTLGTSHLARVGILGALDHCRARTGSSLCATLCPLARCHEPYEATLCRVVVVVVVVVW